MKRFTQVQFRSGPLVRWAMVALGLVTLLLSCFANTGSVAAQDVPSAEQQLADTYAPIAMLRQQSAPCDKAGEGYFPAPVDFIFDNPEIVLRADAGEKVADDPIVATSFTPQDLAAAGPETYIDFPNDPHSPGCAYEEYFKKVAAEHAMQPTTYAHIVVDEGTRKLYVQYWFWYLFNDWNNTHESDWEMIQLVFNATSAEDALKIGPEQVDFAQHEGGETARWNGNKLEHEDTHPIVYPGAGSHATYFNRNVYVSWGENGSGFGCDDTRAPVVETPLHVVVVPDPVDPEGEFAWALFQGRWGQRGAPLFNGPLGPNLSEQWTDPEGATASWGDSSMGIPASKALGLDPTRSFCSLTQYGSQVAGRLIEHIWIGVVLGIAILGAILFCLYRVWPYFLEALDIYGNELATFLGIGLMAVPIGLLFNLLVSFLGTVPVFDQVTQWFDETTGARFTAASIVGGLQQTAMLLLVVPAVVQAMKDIRRGMRPSVRRSYRSSLKHLPAVAIAFACFFLIITSVSFSIFLLPLAIYVAVRFQFFVQAVILDHETPGWNALKRSWWITQGQWMRTFLFSIPFLILAAAPGPIIGLIFLVLGGSRVRFANFASSFLYALMIPLAYIGLTMAYHRLKGDRIVEPLMMTRAARTNDVDGVESIPLV